MRTLDDAARQRQGNTARQRAYRSRRRRDLSVVGVTVSFAVLDALIDWQWLQAGEAEDRREVGRAITARRSSLRASHAGTYRV
jgi:hypothetical protein